MLWNNAVEVITLKAGVRNQGGRMLVAWLAQTDCELELDGQWYQRMIRELGPPAPLFAPGRQFNNVVIRPRADF